MKKNLPRADLEAALAIRGSTTDAKNATVDIMGFPLCENGIGWYVMGPESKRHLVTNNHNSSWVFYKLLCFIGSALMHSTIKAHARLNMGF